jgi:hypothetical protein
MKGPNPSHLACSTGVGANVIKHFLLERDTQYNGATHLKM